MVGGGGGGMVGKMRYMGYSRVGRVGTAKGRDEMRLTLCGARVDRARPEALPCSARPESSVAEGA